MSKPPDFEGLAMFAKVAEERSFAGAAQAMGVFYPLAHAVAPESGLADLFWRLDESAKLRFVIAQLVEPA